MNKKNILKIWFDKTFKKVVKVDNIDKIKQLMKEKQVVLKDLQESYYESKGELKTLQDKIKEYDKTIEDIIAAKNRILSRYEDPDNGLCNDDIETIRKLSTEAKVGTYKHIGFWIPVETVRDRLMLEQKWQERSIPWRA